MTLPLAANTTSVTRHYEMISPTGLEPHWRMDLFRRSKRHPEFDLHGCLAQACSRGLDCILAVRLSGAFDCLAGSGLSYIVGDR